jgi:hypothetical protein
VTKRDDTVVLRGVRVPLNSDVGMAFTTDCARNRERIFSDEQIREKYSIDTDVDWNDILKNKPLKLAVSRECERRMLNGTAAQENAAKQFVDAPEVLGNILRDNKASPRHRIDASRELRATANPGADQPTNDAERFTITINLGANERLVFDGSSTPPNKAQETIDGE